MEQINTKTFCAAPWFMLRANKDGTFKPCCEFKQNLSKFIGNEQSTSKNLSIEEWSNSKYMDYVRKNLSEGVKIPECSVCWKKEDAGLTSLRQTSNNIVTNGKNTELQNTWLNSFFKNKNINNRRYMLLAADLKISNKCNFACVMCNPSDSSKLFSSWSKDYKNTFVNDYLKNDKNYFNSISKIQTKKESYEILKKTLNYPIRLLKLLGGEPLLEKQMLEILRDLPEQKKKKISLSFCTNGSIDILSTIKKYKLDFKSLTFVVSLEGVGEIQNWARKGSDWKQIEKNITSAKKEGILIDIQNTLQASTILRICDLYDWCIEKNIPLIFNMLEQPTYLSINILSNKIRNTLFNSLKKQQEKIKNTKINLPKESYPNTLYNYLQQHFLLTNKEENKKFYRFIEWYEKDSKLKLKKIVPELYK